MPRGAIYGIIRNKKASLVMIENKRVVHNRNCYIPDLDYNRIDTQKDAI